MYFSALYSLLSLLFYHFVHILGENTKKLCIYWLYVMELYCMFYNWSHASFQLIPLESFLSCFAAVVPLTLVLVIMAKMPQTALILNNLQSF